jgi:predicted O-methyltransferase YrrM
LGRSEEGSIVTGSPYIYTNYLRKKAPHMANRTVQLTDELYDYIVSVSVREPQTMRDLRTETATLAEAGMQIGPEQAQFMSLLIKLIGAKRTLELGTFTGYSALTVALALPEDGQIVACDVSDEWTSIGRRYWEEAGVAHKIDLRIAPALETISKLSTDASQQNTFDFAFIDADKENYGAYFEHCMKLVRPGGLIAIDNVLRGGAVVDKSDQDAGTAEIRELNAKLAYDERVDVSLVPIGDGLTLVRKR